jgi:tetratricopeptide (TPR) repeat protein
MKKVYLIVAILLTMDVYVLCQIPLTVLASGGNKKASVSERIGLTDVIIHYDRPGVKGREGKVWGQLVPVGFNDLGFGNTKAAPWRAGANENTTIEFTRPVKIEGQQLPAGKYGFFIAFDPNESTLIFSKNADSWGSYYYNDKEDVLRVKVKPAVLDKSVEWLKYEFSDQSENAATVSLHWEKLAIPFRVETDYINDQLESFRKELRSERGFIWQGWNDAAQWCLQRGVNLDEAVLWADSATSTNFGGDRSFTAWTTKVQLLDKLGRTEESKAAMTRAMAFASMLEMHQYARSLVMQKKPQEAMVIFQANYKNYPKEFTTLVGLVRGYSATGDYKTALKYAQQAVASAPDNLNKTSVSAMVDKLKQGKGIE